MRSVIGNRARSQRCSRGQHWQEHLQSYADILGEHVEVIRKGEHTEDDECSRIANLKMKKQYKGQL